MKKTAAAALIGLVLISGCNVSPLSPSNRNRIRNNGEIGDTNNNQNGLMAEVMSLKNKVDLLARDVENLQSGLVNTNNRNFGVQIFHGEGGLAAGLVLVLALAALTLKYMMESRRYKKTAEIMGEQIKQMSDPQLEERVFEAAMANKVEKDAYRILKG